MPDYKMGDVVNGHRLTEANEWVPVNSPAPTQATPRKKPRVFLWVFLGVQLLFVVWILGGISSVATTGDGDAATAIGAGIGIFMILVLWAIVDFLMAVIYGVFRLATRK